jgi:hypothetical protein
METTAPAPRNKVLREILWDMIDTHPLLRMSLPLLKPQDILALPLDTGVFESILKARERFALLVY